MIQVVQWMIKESSRQNGSWHNVQETRCMDNQAAFGDAPPMDTVEESSTRVLNQETSQTMAQLVTTGGTGGISSVSDKNGYFMLKGMLKHKTKIKR